MRASVAEKSNDGATINPCNGRKEFPTAHASALLPGIRVEGYGVEDMAIHRFRGTLQKSFCKEFGSLARGSSSLYIPDREPDRARMTGPDVP
jgi:hypothetical protein